MALCHIQLWSLNHQYSPQWIEPDNRGILYAFIYQSKQPKVNQFDKPPLHIKTLLKEIYNRSRVHLQFAVYCLDNSNTDNCNPLTQALLEI